MITSDYGTHFGCLSYAVEQDRADPVHGRSNDKNAGGQRSPPRGHRGGAQDQRCAARHRQAGFGRRSCRRAPAVPFNRRRERSRDGLGRASCHRGWRVEPAEPPAARCGGRATYVHPGGRAHRAGRADDDRGGRDQVPGLHPRGSLHRSLRGGRPQTSRTGTPGAGPGSAPGRMARRGRRRAARSPTGGSGCTTSPMRAWTRPRSARPATAMVWVDSTSSPRSGKGKAALPWKWRVRLCRAALPGQPRAACWPRQEKGRAGL